MIKILLSIGLIFVATLGFAQSGINNLSFETWTTSSSPNGFFGAGVTQMTVGAQHLNSYARVTSNGQIYTSSTTTGAMYLGSAAFDGAPYVAQPTALAGFYKCSIVGIDSVYIIVDFTNNGNSVETATNYVEITASTAQWTAFNIPLAYSGTPDSVHIYVESNRSIAGNVTLGNSGTILDVDHFIFATPASIKEFDEYNVLLSAYPNPANENFNIIAKTEEATKVEVCDLSGRLIESKNFEGSKININLNNYSPGLYIYKVLNAENKIIKNEKFTVTK